MEVDMIFFEFSADQVNKVDPQFARTFNAASS